MAIPIIDLFAGPGGLGEGFASLTDEKGVPSFRIGVSVEKDPIAHKTLTLRAVFRQLKGTSSIAQYYKFMRQEISREQFLADPAVAAAYEHARQEARCLELGKCDPKKLDEAIKAALQEDSFWVLIGGPPCQAYSVAGRARRVNDASFLDDEKHFLYREYMRIIREHRPAIFIMENVKGLLSSQHAGDPMFERILGDLSHPAVDLEYEVRSFVKRPGENETLEPNDYVIEAEKFGIPQKRHRVILLGVRRDLSGVRNHLLKEHPKQVTVRHAIRDLPKLRSRLSKGDSLESWHTAVSMAPSYIKGWGTDGEQAMVEKVKMYAEKAKSLTTSGAPFFRYRSDREPGDSQFRDWVLDSNLGGYSHHEARSHMDSDLSRYLFASCYAKVHGYSPKLHRFPPALLPAHANLKDGHKQSTPFKDRFRVQCANEPSTTVVAHIAKDGHYYIHYDPVQCRALTVREAARLQTFPDNYHFEGTRTQQYTQIGNAVPPLLARQLAKVVRRMLSDAKRIHSHANSDRHAGEIHRRSTEKLSA
jgi:DNA (cytosine-5)-methyltransferase 1